MKKRLAFILMFAFSICSMCQSIGFAASDGGDINRIYGNSRYDTSIKAANEYKELNGCEKFKNIIVAYGGNFPDALTGSSLSKELNAPIILVNDSNEKSVAGYIKANIDNSGNVYILGGTGVISKTFESKLSGLTVKRLYGKTRFDTNLKILKTVGVENKMLLVCSANGYADALSASATGLPILLVDSKLTAEQKSYIKQNKPGSIYAIGGTSVVPKSVFNEIGTLTGIEVKRVSGKNRYATSVAVAEAFFEKSYKEVVLAYAMNFPDGLSGGPIAIAKKCPLLLVSNSSYADAANLTKPAGVSAATVLGGPSLISDATARKLLVTQTDNEVYTVKPVTTLYERPNTDSESIVVQYKSKLIMIGVDHTSADGTWFEVEYSGKTYYMWESNGDQKFDRKPLSYNYSCDNTYRQAVVDKALTYLNKKTKYISGATGEVDNNGAYCFDCSGYVSAVINSVMQNENDLYRITANVDKQYLTESILNEGKAGEIKAERYKKTSLSELEPGDILFFNINKEANRAVDHCGIYLGNKEFIHCTSSFNKVLIMPLTDIYADSCVGFLKVIPDYGAIKPANVMVKANMNCGTYRIADKSFKTEDVIYANQEVKLLYFNDMWARIEYTNKSGDICIGYVYLDKLAI